MAATIPRNASTLFLAPRKESDPVTGERRKGKGESEESLGVSPLPFCLSPVNGTGRVNKNANEPSPLKKNCGSDIRSCCSGVCGSRLCQGLWYLAGSVRVA